MAKIKTTKALVKATPSSKKAFSYPDEKYGWVIRDPGAKYGHWSVVIGNVTGRAPEAGEADFLGVRKVVQEGIDRRSFERIRSGAGITTEKLSAIVGIPGRTLARRERFRPDETERLLRVASVIQKAVELFEDMDRVHRWMASPKRALGGLTPLECCDTEAGAQEVEDLIERLSDGVYS